MRSPIALWMTSRSRSSMIAGIFAAHGVFWGKKQTQTAGYDTFENEPVKVVLKKHYGLPLCAMPATKPEFITDIYATVPQNETWMIKTGIEYFDAMQPMIPFNIYLLRKPEAVAKSLCQKRPGCNYDEALEIAQWRFNMMRVKYGTVGGAFIDTDRVIAGDFQQLKQAMEFCGIIFDEKKTLGAIKK